MGWTTEDRLLLFLCSSRREAEVPLAVAELTTLDWQRFVSSALKEGLAPLVHHHLQDVPSVLAIMPAYASAALRQSYYATAARNTVIWSELGRVLAASRTAGIEVIVLKGGALAETVYGNLALRPMADVDLLIREEAIRDFDTLMQQCGYSSPEQGDVAGLESRLSYLTSMEYRDASANPVSFHVHWHLVNSSIPNAHIIESFPLTDIWHEAREVSIAGVTARVMSPHHSLIHLCEHALRVPHSLTKLYFLCDINEMINFNRQDLNWTTLLGETRKFKLEAFVYSPLELTQRLLGCGIPEDLLAALRKESRGLLNAAFNWLMRHNLRFAGASYLLYLAQAKGVSAKFMFLLRTVFPPREVIAQRCGIDVSAVGPAFYLRRMGEIFFKLSKVLFR